MSGTVIAYDINQKPHVVNKESLVIRNSDYGVLIINNKILLQLQPEVNLYCLPGGGQDPGESDSDTVIREFGEETGYKDIEVLELAGEGQSCFTYGDTNFDSRYKFYVVKLNSVVQGEITDKADSFEAKFFDINTLDLSTVAHIHRKIIKKFQNR